MSNALKLAAALLRGSSGLVYVGGASNGNTTGAAFNVSLTALTGGIGSAAQEGDIVIVVNSLASGTSGTNPGVSTSGYTEEQDLQSGSSTIWSHLSVSWKIMGSTPDTLVDINAGVSSYGNAAAVHVWRGVNQTTPFDVAETTATGINTSRANPPAITPTTSGAIIIACGAGIAGTGVNYTSSDLSNFVAFLSNTSLDSEVGIGSYVWVSGAFNPAQFTSGGTGVTDFWCAVTLALRPA